MTVAHPIVELRQYTLLPGQRDVLVELFDREFVTGQEAEGMAIIGQFRDLDRADRFVWLRGFSDMASRLASLTAFYTGACWMAHRDAANATMDDVSDVLLLHPVTTIEPQVIPSSGSGLLVATIVHLNDAGIAEFPAAFTRSVHPTLTKHGAEVVAAYETETSPNDYPRLPVREGERVFVWLSRFAGVDSYEEHTRSIATSDERRSTVQPVFDRLTTGAPTILRLEATPGSRYQP